jgi:hypothetical protein
MLKIVEYAALSAHVYDPNKTQIRGIKIKTLEASNLAFEPSIEWYRIIFSSRDNFPSWGFYAQLYVKFSQGRVTDAVMVIRGSSSLKDYWIDFQSFASDVLADGRKDKIPHYLHLAITTYNKYRRYLSSAKILENRSTSLKITGHSLGGVIAQLIPFQAGYPAIAITFNSPGCGHLLNDKSRSVEDYCQHIVNVDSRYGIINKIGLKVGCTYLIDVPEMEAAAKALEASYGPALIDYINGKMGKLATEGSATSFKEKVKYVSYEGEHVLIYLSEMRYFLPKLEWLKIFETCFIGDPACIFQKALSDSSQRFAEILYAQHSMKNLLNALFEGERNISIGNLVF